jgi:hypothetical protein
MRIYILITIINLSVNLKFEIFATPMTISLGHKESQCPLTHSLIITHYLSSLLSPTLSLSPEIDPWRFTLPSVHSQLMRVSLTPVLSSLRKLVSLPFYLLVSASPLKTPPPTCEPLDGPLPFPPPYPLTGFSRRLA